MHVDSIDHEKDAIALAVATLPQLASRKQTAEFLNVSERTIDRLLRRGELDAVDVAGRVRVLQTSIERYIRAAG